MEDSFDTNINAADKPQGVSTSRSAVTICTRQLLIDVSTTAAHGEKNGIQRVVRSITKELLEFPPPGWTVNPVVCVNGQPRYAKTFSRILLGKGVADSYSLPATLRENDIYLALDPPTPGICFGELYASLRNQGVVVHAVVYDLTLVTSPSRVAIRETDRFSEWLTAIIENADGITCSSRTTANALWQYLCQRHQLRTLPLRINCLDLGCDIMTSAPNAGLPNGLSWRERRGQLLQALFESSDYPVMA